MWYINTNISSQTQDCMEEAILSLKIRSQRSSSGYDLVNTSKSWSSEDGECKWRLPCSKWCQMKWQVISKMLGVLMEVSLWAVICKLPWATANNAKMVYMNCGTLPSSNTIPIF